MLKKNIIKSSSQAQSYYKKEYAREDYYGKDAGNNVIGQWLGKGASKLGLEGGIKPEDFHNICNNLTPEGDNLTARNDKNRRSGFDFTFNAPKSISLLYCVSGNNKILDAFNNAVEKAISEVEKDVGVRVRGKMASNTTSNMIVGQFNHTTSRPLEDGYPDPHLHAHCFIANASYEKKSDKWKAIDYATISKNTNYYEAIFHSELAKSIKDMGIDIRERGRFWEVKNIKDETLEKFSRRTSLIEKIADEKGISNPKTKQELGKKTRKIKKNDLSKASIMDYWQSNLSVDEVKTLKRIKEQEAEKLDIKITAREAVDMALKHITERQSTFKRKHLVDTALRYGYGDLDKDLINWILDGDNSGCITSSKDAEKMTTVEVVREESKIIDYVNEGFGTCETLGKGKYEFKDDIFLNDKYDTAEQKDAVLNLLSSRNFVDYIKGRAGTGKTTILKEVYSGIKENEGDVIALSPTTDAKHVLQKEGLSDADTVASFLLKGSYKDLEGKTIIIDEAGLVGASDMSKVMSIAKENNSRVILCGDTEQNSPVARGTPLSLVERETSIKPFELNKINRQNDESYKQAVKFFQDGNIDNGFKMLDRIDAVVEEKTISKRYDILVDDYIDCLYKNETALVISPTHNEANLITSQLRHELKEKGIIGKEERSFGTLKSKDMTIVEKSRASSFTVDDIVEYNRKYQGIAKGERLKVLAVEDGKVKTISLKTGEEQDLRLSDAGRYNVYKHEEKKFAIGDDIRITKNSTDVEGRPLPNGGIYKISKIEGNQIQLESNKEKYWVKKDIAHMNYGYVVTSYSSQGKTVDNAFLAQNTSSASKMASNMKQFYVSISRGKRRLRIYTDDKKELQDVVKTNKGNKESGVDVAMLEYSRTNQAETQRENVR